MKKILFAAAIVLTSGSAFAADLVVKAPPMRHSWTGCYVGAAGGGVWGKSRHVSATGDITNSFDISGGIVGVEYGCNYQTGMWVIGTESDFSWTNKTGSATDIGAATTSSTKERWFSTTRARLGYLMSDTVLLYATGGLANARIEATANTGAGVFTESKTRWGWTAGLGTEVALNNNWSVKADYLYARFTDRDYLTPSPAAGVTARTNVAVDDHIVRVGVHYKYSNCFLPILNIGCAR